MQELQAEQTAIKEANDELRRNDRLLTRLSEIRAGHGDAFAPALVNEDYIRAFADNGINLRSNDTHEAAAVIGKRFPKIAADLAAILDDWAIHRGGEPTDVEQMKRLIMLAQQIDAVAWRNRLRDAILRNDQRAIKAEAAAADPRALDSHSVQLLALALRGCNDNAGSVGLLQAVRLNDPRDVWINYDLAVSLSNLDPPDLTGAIRYFTAAQSLRPELGHDLGHMLRDHGDVEEEVEVFRRLTVVRPENARHWFCLGSALAHRGRLDEAVTAYRKVIDLNGEVAESHFRIGGALLFTGANMLPSGRDGKLGSGAVSSLSGNWVDRSARIDSPAPGNPADAKRLLTAAIDEFRKAIALHCRDQAHALSGIGVAFSELGRHDEAVASQRQALALDPKKPIRHVSLATALGASGDVARAIAEYKAALAIDPRLEVAHEGLGKLYGDQHRYQEAIEELRSAIKLNPDWPIHHGRLAGFFVQIGNFKDAVGEFREAIRLAPKWLAVHVGLGHALLQLGSKDEALAEFRKVVDFSPDWAMGHLHLGIALKLTGQLEEAVNEFRSASRLDPANDMTRRLLSNALDRARAKASEREVARRGARRVLPGPSRSNRQVDA